MTKIFLYGTLMRGFPHLKHLGVDKDLKYLGKGKMRGRIFDLGEYPAAIADKETVEYVYGEIFLVQNEEHVLRKLDEFEEAIPSRNRKSLFIRKKVKICTSEGKETFAWAYLYNQPLEKAFRIASGDFKKHVNLKRAFSRAHKPA